MKLGDKNTIVIVGAGLSGAVLAERYASIGKKVLVLEKREHIAGNCYDYIAEHGILKSKYGAHLFHCSDKYTWDYVNRFSQWNNYEHRVLSLVDGKLVPVPANMDTYNALLGSDFKTSEGMQKFIDNSQYANIEVKNSEDSALKRLGSNIIYNLMFKNYTKKQWDMYPEELEASVMERIPVRTNHDDRYFNDKYEAIPTEGYTKFVENMLSSPLIEVKLNTDFFDNKVEYEKLFFAGKIDEYFKDKFGPLQYRSLKFVDTVEDTNSFQQVAVVNYPQEEYPFTRIVEHKKLYGKGEEGKTIITKEFSTWVGEPFYPVPTQKNRDLYELYKRKAEESEKNNIYFIGRLAEYKYINMNIAIKNSLDTFYKLEGVK